MCNPHWTAYISALTLPAIAVVASLIAYRQWRTAQNKLKLDLFEKRMLVYQASRDMLGFVATRGKITTEEQIKYITGIQTAKWLFGVDVGTYLEKTLWEKIVDLELHQTMIYDGDRDDPDRQKHVQSKAETLKWLMKQYTVLDAKCANYLVVGH